MILESTYHQDCEDEVGRTTNDPVTMEAVLNRLQVLQDKAISQGVYALESKVSSILDTFICAYSSMFDRANLRTKVKERQTGGESERLREYLYWRDDPEKISY